MALIAVAAGCFLGWYACLALTAHADVKFSRVRTRRYRHARYSNGFVTVAIAAVIVLYAVLSHR